MEKIGIISAMWVEAKLLADAMQDVKITEYNGMPYYEGMLGGRPVVLSTCGVGKVNAALYTQLMLDRFDVKMLIHTGVAGSLDDAVRHLDIVTASGLTYHDVKKSVMTDLFPYQEIFRTQTSLTDLLQECAEAQCKMQKDGTKAHKGLIITGDDFVTNKQQKRVLKERFSQALCVEMESCAVAHAAFVNKVPFGVIRCISDLADGSAHEDYAVFEKKAADKAAEIVIQALKKIKK